ncbi:hypothetical protein MIND_00935000 [Mycena indigotica]|uniref:Uncharacterized protein n=1 Tax=Mycena indigotica TaxID=2126181 RepID=A0A8H6SFR1_9AGAR|nr:uncharacterized protein MIND_00935000 [Mycena indigotica]KAF7297025.1 hypothetical protein MIND_00935000 [Mycena indigotica]
MYFSTILPSILLALPTRMLVSGVRLVPTNADAFDKERGAPPGSSAADLLFYWHDDDDSGDHNMVATTVYMMTNGGNGTLSDTTANGYPLEAVAVQFNSSHFKFELKQSNVPWLAIFPCTSGSKAGNSSALIENAERLGAVAALTYTEGSVYAYCNLTDNNPPTKLPIYATENWAHAFNVFSDELPGLFKPSKVPYYDPDALTNLAANISADLNALKGESFAPVLIKTPVILARIPPVASNVTAAVAQVASSLSVVAASRTAAATRPSTSPSSALRSIRSPVLAGSTLALVAVAFALLTLYCLCGSADLSLRPLL